MIFENEFLKGSLHENKNDSGVAVVTVVNQPIRNKKINIIKQIDKDII